MLWAASTESLDPGLGDLRVGMLHCLLWMLQRGMVWHSQGDCRVSFHTYDTVLRWLQAHPSCCIEM